MKKLFTLLCIIISFASYATMRTVCNTPTTLAQYNNIQAAVDACNTSGDTIYVIGSPNPYEGFTITDKQITIIGPGWAPNKTFLATAIISSTVFINGTASSGTELQGFHFIISSPYSPSSVTIQNNTVINNIRFIRNKMTGFTSLNWGATAKTYTGYLFEGNYFENSKVSDNSNSNSTFTNFIFQNNIFYGLYDNINGFTNCVNVLFNHNLFYGPASGTSNVFGTTYPSKGIILNNNIFVRRDVANGSANNTFTNNITFNAGNNTPWLSNGNIDAGGNISNQDPQMVGQASVNSGINNPLLDFTIATGPANNSGTDGKDIGLLFDAVGSLNWTSSRTSFLPYIYSMNITNPTIPAGGTLNVVVTAKKDN